MNKTQSRKDTKTCDDTSNISLTRLFCEYIRCVRTNSIIVATNALGIEAASFASDSGAGTGFGKGNGALSLSK